jgi:ABC-type multidrug transport system fused ATPase/permease subunit
VDLDREEIHFKTILGDGTFSSGERTLLKVAASLFNRDHFVNLWEVFNKLDDTNTSLVLQAIESFCMRLR